MKCSTLILFFLCFIVSCQQVSNVETKNTAEQYFEIYAERQNFEAFMNYYAENAMLEDIVSGEQFNGIDEIKSFFDWHKGDFVMPNEGRLLSISKQLIQDNTVITQGEFHGFTYNGRELGPWAFVIVQEFDKQQRIVKQSDWINYSN